MHFNAPPAVSNLAAGLREGEVHIWRARAEAVVELLDRECLSAEELARASRFRLPGLGEAFLFAHRFLRQVLAPYLSVRPADLIFEAEQGGKPFIQGTVGFSFNLTHCGSAALLVVSAGRPVGIDLENCARKVDVPSLALACLGDLDRHDLESAPPDQRCSRLLQWWTRKEALLKAQGCGLARDPRDLAVCWPGTPIAWEYFQDQGRTWVIADLDLGDRWRAAVSMEGQLPRLRGFCLGW